MITLYIARNNYNSIVNCMQYNNYIIPNSFLSSKSGESTLLF